MLILLYCGIPCSAFIAVILFLIFRVRKYKNLYNLAEKKQKESGHNYIKLNKEIKVASDQISSIALQLAIILNESNNYSKSLLDKTEEMRTKNLEMTRNSHDSIEDIRENLDLITNMLTYVRTLQATSIQSENIIRNSLVDLKAVLGTVAVLNKCSEETTVYAERMKNTSSQVIKILDTVRDISEKTSLLAFNARIESARAGEYGNGFTVVANEIGKLSEGSDKALDSIKQHITSIIDEINDLYRHTEENSRYAEEGTKAIHSMEKNLTDIENSFGTIFSLIESINTVSNEQSDKTRDLEDNIKHLENTISIAKDSVTELHSSIVKQHDEMLILNEMGARLKKSSSGLQGMSTNDEDNRFETASEDYLKNLIFEAKKTIQSNLLSNKNLKNSIADEHCALLTEFLDDNLMFEAAWTNDLKGKFITSVPPSGIMNASEREWFRNALNSGEYISDIYLSAITHEPCLTLSFPLKDINNNMYGVLGLDIKIA